MGLVGRIMERLGRGVGLSERTKGWRVLAHLGIESVFLSWSRGQGGSLGDVWRVCPRPDWLVELALKAGVDRKIVRQAVADCVGAIDSFAEAPSVALRQRALEVADAWVVGDRAGDEVCALLQAVVDDAFDNDPALRRARISRNDAVGRQFSEARIQADLSERNYLARLSEVVRTQISREELYAALFGEMSDSPYR